MATLESLEVELRTLREDNRDDHQQLLARFDRLNGTVAHHDRCITQIQERQTLWHAVQGVYTTVLVAITGYLGLSR